MKRCPECRRDYFDDSLFYCLDDGTRLVEGPGSATSASTGGPPPAERPTALLSDLPSEGRTQLLPARKSGRNIWLIAAALAVLISTGFFAYRYFSSDNKAQQIESIAVLPFENASGNAEIDYLTDGVSESVIDSLSKLPRLKVIARSSSFRYRGKDLDLAEIGEALGVQAIVTGRVVPRGDGYSIRVELIDARQNKHLWGQSFDRKTSDLQSLNTDISRQVAEHLRIRLSGAQTVLLAGQRSIDPQAYELLLKGRFWFNKAGTKNFEKAAEFYEQAVSTDPSYALAYAELAEAYVVLGGLPGTPSYTTSERKLLLQKAAAAAGTALVLDEGLAEAHYAMAGVKLNHWEWQEAEREFQKAFALNPNIIRPQLLSGYAGFLSLVKRHDEAVAETKRVLEISPLSLVVTGSAAVVYLYARRYEDALQASNKRFELDRSLPVPYGRLGEIYEAKQMYNEAAAAYQDAIRLRGGDELSRENAFLGAVYAKTGEQAKAKEILQKLESAGDKVKSTDLARLYEALGRRADAIAQLEKAFADRESFLPLVGVDPGFDSMRSEPRFQDLVRRMGLPQ